jgi:hypothetical protein
VFAFLIPAYRYRSSTFSAQARRFRALGAALKTDVSSRMPLPIPFFLHDFLKIKTS